MLDQMFEENRSLSTILHGDPCQDVNITPAYLALETIAKLGGGGCIQGWRSIPRGGVAPILRAVSSVRVATG